LTPPETPRPSATCANGESLTAAIHTIAVEAADALLTIHEAPRELRFAEKAARDEEATADQQPEIDSSNARGIDVAARSGREKRRDGLTRSSRRRFRIHTFDAPSTSAWCRRRCMDSEHGT
jgi:hypothetical protein